MSAVPLVSEGEEPPAVEFPKANEHWAEALAYVEELRIQLW